MNLLVVKCSCEEQQLGNLQTLFLFILDFRMDPFSVHFRKLQSYQIIRFFGSIISSMIIELTVSFFSLHINESGCFLLIKCYIPKICKGSQYCMKICVEKREKKLMVIWHSGRACSEWSQAGKYDALCILHFAGLELHYASKGGQISRLFEVEFPKRDPRV